MNKEAAELITFYSNSYLARVVVAAPGISTKTGEPQGRDFGYTRRPYDSNEFKGALSLSGGKFGKQDFRKVFSAEELAELTEKDMTPEKERQVAEVAARRKLREDFSLVVTGALLFIDRISSPNSKKPEQPWISETFAVQYLQRPALRVPAKAKSAGTDWLPEVMITGQDELYMLPGHQQMTQATIALLANYPHFEDQKVA